jgi:hypothetical protein
MNPIELKTLVEKLQLEGKTDAEIYRWLANEHSFDDAEAAKNSGLLYKNESNNTYTTSSEVIDYSEPVTAPAPSASPSFPFSALLFLLLGFLRLAGKNPVWGGFLILYGVVRIGYYLYESSKD